MSKVSYHAPGCVLRNTCLALSNSYLRFLYAFTQSFVNVCGAPTSSKGCKAMLVTGSGGSLRKEPENKSLLIFMHERERERERERQTDRQTDTKD